MPLFIVPKFLRNLTVAESLWLIGVLVWLSGLDLIFPIKYITIVMNFLNDVYDVTHSTIRPSKEGLFYCPQFSQMSIFLNCFRRQVFLNLKDLLCLQISHLRKSLVQFFILGYNICILQLVFKVRFNSNYIYINNDGKPKGLFFNFQICLTVYLFIYNKIFL